MKTKTKESIKFTMTIISFAYVCWSAYQEYLKTREVY